MANASVSLDMSVCSLIDGLWDDWDDLTSAGHHWAAQAKVDQANQLLRELKGALSPQMYEILKGCADNRLRHPGKSPA